MEHKHHGKSSAKFLDAEDILNEMHFNGDETFMDAGCGDGYISIKAAKKYLPQGIVYAVDSYDVAINELEEYKDKNDVQNLINVHADITEGIPSISDDSVDAVLMLNVFHGFRLSEDRGNVINELGRVIKNHGKIAVMEFKPLKMSWGPPVDVRISSDDLEEVFSQHDFKKVYLNEDIGSDIPEGKSHYLMIFEKE